MTPSGACGTPSPAEDHSLKFPLVWANHASSTNAWTAIETTSGTTPMTPTSYAYCANTPLPLALTGAGSVTAIQTGSATTPACPADRPLISGWLRQHAGVGRGQR